MARPSPPVVIGVDAGGTHTKAIVAATDGTVLGRGRAAGANRRSSAGDPAANLAAALRDAIDAASAEPAAVLYGVVAMAGAGAAGRADAKTAVQSAWSAAGLPGCPALVVDVVAAHAAGSPRRAGLVLIGGTGSVAAAVQDAQVVARADGAGWLLGDDGSAVRLGLAAIQATVRALDGRGAETVLLPAVLTALGVPRDPDDQQTVQRIIAAVDALHPAEFGQLAPLVNEAAAGGDAVARDIAEQAATALLGALDAVRHRAVEVAGEPPVLAGSVLLSPGPVADIVAAEIFARYGKPPTTAGDGAGGAAWLALRAVHGDRMAPGTHARLTQSR